MGKQIALFLIQLYVNVEYTNFNVSSGLVECKYSWTFTYLRYLARSESQVVVNDFPCR